MLECQPLGPGLKEVRERLFSLVVACWTKNHWILSSKRLEGSLREAGKSNGSMLDCQSQDLGIKEAGGRLFSPVVAHWNANYWILG